MTFFTLNQFFIIAINILAILIGVLVYKSNPKGKVNRIMPLMVIFMLLWVDFAYIPRLTGKEKPDLALMLLKISWFVTPLFFISLYFLVIYILKKEEKYKILNKFVLFFGILAAFITGFTSLIVSSIRFVGQYMAINYGSGMLFFLGIISFLVFATLYILFKGYFQAPYYLKLKLQYFIIGIFIFYVANIIFNITLPVAFDIVRFYWIGDYSTLFLLGFAAYAIVKQHLFDIKIIATEMLAFSVSVTLLVNALISKTQGEFILKFLIFIGGSMLGALLVRAVLKDVEVTEKIKALAKERDRANRKLKRANKDLQKLDQAKSEFLSIASHQLRTPLSAIRGLSSMLVDGDYGEVKKEAKDAIEKIEFSSKRLADLVNNLLDISRIESGRTKFNLKEQKLQDIANTVVEELRPAAEQKKIKLVYKAHKNLPNVAVDEEKIRQVMLNFVDNSIKYTDKGVVKISMKLAEMKEILNGIRRSKQYGFNKRFLRGGAEKNGYIVFSVSDKGRGILKSDQENLFQKFVRGKGMSRVHTEGSGLGLYVCRKMVEGHKGLIWAESAGEGKGSKFSFAVSVSVETR
ncbi:ATP-binding protein [Patescibacteria group bacterium]